jgi:hypothetical protein
MADERLRLTWINTAGGPHLVIPERYAPAWEGCFVPSGGRVIEATFRCNPNGPATDYDCACNVSGWLGVIRVGRSQAMVLSGDDTQAAYYHWGRGHFILSWLYAESETELLDHFHDVQATLPVEEEAVFRHPGGKVFLMDSVDLPGRWMGPHAEFQLPRGRYLVETGHSETESTYLIVHRLRPDKRARQATGSEPRHTRSTVTGGSYETGSLRRSRAGPPRPPH